MIELKNFNEALRFLERHAKPLNSDEIEMLIYIQGNPAQTLDYISYKFAIRKERANRLVSILVDHGFVKADKLSRDPSSYTHRVTEEGALLLMNIRRLLSRKT